MGYRDDGHESHGSHSHEPPGNPPPSSQLLSGFKPQGSISAVPWVGLGEEESLLLVSEGLDLFPQSLILTHSVPHKLTRFPKEVLVCCKGHLFATGRS